jgi:erythromycin esterase-like protein
MPAAQHIRSVMALSVDRPLFETVEMAEPVPFATFPLGSAKDVVDGIPHDRRIVLLGESTHGTECFYKTRAEITKRLIEERGFTAVVFEADWPFMRRVNAYTHSVGSEPSTPYPNEERFPKWMWKNQVMCEFFDWCKSRHSLLLQSQRSPELFGMDCYSLFESKNALIKFLETHDNEFAKEAKERLRYLDKYETGHEYGEDMVLGNMSRAASHLQDVLTKIQARLESQSSQYACSDVERLSAEQNCEIVIAADEYYKKCVSEPAGSQASWNARDQVRKRSTREGGGRREGGGGGGSLSVCRIFFYRSPLSLSLSSI